jgi:DNA-binding transcriptional ArsR family regulator
MQSRLTERDVKGYFRKMSFASPADEPRLTSADALRALGHPTRLKLLGRLRIRGDATATECAEDVGESASSCSYHLRTLARHGFVEQVPSEDGRERRWRARVSSVDWDAGAAADDDFRAAAALARAALIELSDETLRTYLEHESSFSPAWQEAATFLQTAIVATPAELDDLARRIQEALAPLRADVRTPKRGSRVVHVSVRAVPEP